MTDNSKEEHIKLALEAYKRSLFHQKRHMIIIIIIIIKKLYFNISMTRNISQVKKQPVKCTNCKENHSALTEQCSVCQKAAIQIREAFLTDSFSLKISLFSHYLIKQMKLRLQLSAKTQSTSENDSQSSKAALGLGLSRSILVESYGLLYSIIPHY